MLADQPHEGSFTGEYPRWGPACGAGMECPLTRREKLPEMRPYHFAFVLHILKQK